MKKDEITIKNTKAEILDALNAALEREKNINKVKSEPEKEEKKRKIEESIEQSKTNVDNNIFSEELVEKFNTLNTAISAMEEKLKNLYGVEKELNSLTLVINAGKDCISEIENKKAKEEETLNISIKNLENEFKKKNEELTSEYELKAKTLKLERERELEEYNYKLKREREINNNKWEDEKLLREKVLKEKEDEIEKTLSDVKLKEGNLNDLEKRVNEIPELLEKEYLRGKKEVTLELEKEHKYSTELLKKDYQNIIDRQNDKIESLKEELAKTNKLNEELQDRIAKAYVEMKELATKTVESNGSVKIIGNNQSDNK